MYSKDYTDAEELEGLIITEFDSLFEGFTLVMEMKKILYESSGKIVTQKPSAVFVQSEGIELWRTGRKKYRMQEIIKSHIDISWICFGPT